MKIDFEATSGNYSIIADDVSALIVERKENIVLNFYRYINPESMFVDDPKEKEYLHAYSVGYNCGLRACQVLNDEGLNVRKIFGLEEKKDYEGNGRSMKIDLNSSGEEIIEFLFLKDKVKLLNGEFVSPLWVPSHLLEKAKKFMDENGDKWNDSEEKKEVKPEARWDCTRINPPFSGWIKLSRSPDSEWREGTEFFLTPNDEIYEVKSPSNIAMSVQIINKHSDVGIYLIKDFDGKMKQLYLKKENKSEPELETFDFYEAMRRLYNGKIVKNLEDSFVYRFRPKGIDTLEMRPADIDDEWVDATIFKTDLKHIFQEVKEKPKTFGWDEAYRMMKEGKKVRRKVWKNKDFLMWILEGNSMEGDYTSDSAGWSLDILDLDATDWYVYEE